MTTRAQMAARLELSRTSPTKTFVIEAHTKDPRETLASMLWPAHLEETEDAYIFRVRAPQGEFWVDQLDERFWSVHTDLAVKDATAFLSPIVEHRRDLDWVWLPSDHLRHVWPDAVARRVRTTFNGSQFVDDTSPARDLRVQLSGRDADSLLDVIARDARYRSAVSFESIQASIVHPDFGAVEEAVNKMGRFAVSGDSFELHQQFVQRVVKRYSRLVRLCESKAIGFRPFGEPDEEAGGRLDGGPIVIRFSRNIEDIEQFAAALFSSRQPFRLWGVPQVNGDLAEVQAVDLHVGQTLPIDIGTDWMRITLREGSCGNTIVRLITNLQHSFDGALRLEDPALDSALHTEIA